MVVDGRIRFALEIRGGFRGVARPNSPPSDKSYQNHTKPSNNITNKYNLKPSNTNTTAY